VSERERVNLAVRESLAAAQNAAGQEEAQEGLMIKTSMRRRRSRKRRRMRRRGRKKRKRSRRWRVRRSLTHSLTFLCLQAEICVGLRLCQTSKTKHTVQLLHWPQE
jgi:hypothetical protein